MRKYLSDFRKYLFELIIIITGISISFMVQNWREAAANRKLEIHILERIRTDLAADTASMRAELQLVDLISRGAKAILANEEPYELNDSLNLFIYVQMNYSAFKKSDIGYLAMKQGGRSDLISNKVLSDQIIRQYAIDYPYLEEWFETDQKFLLDHYLPFFHSRFPYLENYAVDWEKLKPVIQTDEYRNLVRSNLVMKYQIGQFFRKNIESATALMQAIEQELDRIGQD